MPGEEPSAEFRIPDSELEGSLELRVPTPEPARLLPVPSGMVLFPRRTIYVQAGLYFVVALAAFGAGFLIGGGTGDKRSAEDAAALSRVPVSGRIRYDPGSGSFQNDEGAVVIVLPAGKPPSSLLPIEGLRPGSASSADHLARQAIESFGGALARAEKDGSFHLYVPRRGKYSLLVISRNGSRASTVSNRESDVAALGRYFNNAAALLKDVAYDWRPEAIDPDPKPIDVDFR